MGPDNSNRNMATKTMASLDEIDAAVQVVAVKCSLQTPLQYSNIPLPELK